MYQKLLNMFLGLFVVLATIGCNSEKINDLEKEIVKFKTANEDLSEDVKQLSSDLDSLAQKLTELQNQTDQTGRIVNSNQTGLEGLTQKVAHTHVSSKHAFLSTPVNDNGDKFSLIVTPYGKVVFRQNHENGEQTDVEVADINKR